MILHSAAVLLVPTAQAAFAQGSPDDRIPASVEGVGSLGFTVTQAR